MVRKRVVERPVSVPLIGAGIGRKFRAFFADAATTAQFQADAVLLRPTDAPESWLLEADDPDVLAKWVKRLRVALAASLPRASDCTGKPKNRDQATGSLAPRPRNAPWRISRAARAAKRPSPVAVQVIAQPEKLPSS